MPSLPCPEGPAPRAGPATGPSVTACGLRPSCGQGHRGRALAPGLDCAAEHADSFPPFWPQPTRARASCDVPRWDRCLPLSERTIPHRTASRVWRVDRSPEETFDFLARSYRVARVVALGVVSVVGVLVSVAALDLKVSDRWSSVRLPLWVFALVAAALLVLIGIPAVVMSVMLRDSMETASYFSSKASHLEDAVRGLESLAYTDPITGIPNSNALRRELERSANQPRRCLILLDLEDFGAVNKRFDHWSGDEYLRRFSEMVSRSSRRNEFLYKLRPEVEGPSSVQEEAKTFRKNTGGDEFFVLLEGTVLEGLGYLRRLQLRKREFDEMSREVLGDYHPFGFTAGVIAVAPRETCDQATRRVSQSLALARTGASVYWNEGDLPEPIPNSLEATLREQVLETFGDPRSSRRPDGS